MPGPWRRRPPPRPRRPPRSALPQRRRGVRGDDIPRPRTAADGTLAGPGLAGQPGMLVRGRHRPSPSVPPYACPMVRRAAADDDVPGRRSNWPELPEASTTGLHVIAALAFRGGGLHRSRGRVAGSNGSSDWNCRPAGRPNGSAAAISAAAPDVQAGRSPCQASRRSAKPCPAGRTCRWTPRASMSSRITRARTTRSWSRVMVRAIQSM